MKLKGNQMISDLLVSGRKSLGMTQSEAAQKIGISRTTLAMMEANGDAVASASWMTVVKALRVTGQTLSLNPVERLPNLDELLRNNKKKSDERLFQARQNEDSDSGFSPM